MIVLFRTCKSLLIFCLLALPITDKGVVKCSSIIVYLSVSSHPPCEPQGILGFLHPHSGESVGYLEGNSWDALKTVISRIFSPSCESTLSFQQFIKITIKCFCQFVSPAASTLDKQILVSVSLCMCLFLQIFRWWFALRHQFSLGFKKSHWFSVFPAFSNCNDRNDEFQALYMLDVKLELNILLYELPNSFSIVQGTCISSKTYSKFYQYACPTRGFVLASSNFL